MSDPAREATGKLGAYAYSNPKSAVGEGNPERTVADILRDAVDNVQDIIRSEVRLAKIEIQEEVRKVTSAGKMFGIAAVLGLYGAGFLLLCLVYALALLLPAWAAALIVGVLCTGIAAFCALAGRKQIKQVHMPEKTMFTVREDVEWIRNQKQS